MRRWERNNHRQKWSEKEVEEHWDRVASIYIEENNKVKGTHDQRFHETVKHLHPAPGLKILNITSRDCEVDDYIKNTVPDAKVTNAEISAGLMQEAQKIRPHVKQQKIETYSELPFHDGYFNRIISLETLEHVSNPISFLNELHRVSTKEARMILSCPPASIELIYRVYTTLFGGHGEGPHRFLSSKEVKVLFEKTGWKLLLHKGTILLPVGSKMLQDFGEMIIQRFQNTFISELGIRQFYVCEKY